ncbi:hypothetical protein GGI35DRAFT_486374 [Trichoderma velutinum]
MNNKSVNGNITAEQKAKTTKEPISETIPPSSDNVHPAHHLAAVSCESCGSNATSRGQTSETQTHASAPTAAEVKSEPQASESAAKQEWDQGTKPGDGIQLNLGSDSCFLINSAPFANNERCVECNLAGKMCTRIGFKPPQEQYRDLITSRKAACILFQQTGRSKNTLEVLRQMKYLATTYMVNMWNHGQFSELLDVHWKLDAAVKRVKKTKAKKKNRKPKSKSEEASADKDASAKLP